MDAGDHAIFDTASPAGILPMSLVRLDSTTPNEARALEALYLKAAQVPWVKHLAAQPGVSQYTDLHTACKYGSQDCWTRGLLVQAAVMEMLGFTHEYQTLDNVEKAASDLVEAFAYFVEHGVMFNLNNVPRFRPLMYLRIWMCIQDKVQRPKAPPNGNVRNSD